MSESIGRIGRRSGARSVPVARSSARAGSALIGTALRGWSSELGDEVEACLEMISGALWVRDQLVACGWRVEVADARKVKTVAPLAAKTDKVDARLLAELSRRGLVPALWLSSVDERELQGTPAPADAPRPTAHEREGADRRPASPVGDPQLAAPLAPT